MAKIMYKTGKNTYFLKAKDILISFATRTYES